MHEIKPIAELFPDGSRVDQTLNDAVLGVGAVVLAWIFMWKWPLLCSALTVMVILGIAIRYARIRVRQLLLHDKSLTMLTDGTATTMLFEDIREVSTEWVYKAPTMCKIRSVSGLNFRLRIGEESRAFMHLLGIQLIEYRRQIHAQPSACELLGWPMEPTQLD